MNPITLGYTPCPNDTFIFTAWTERHLADAMPVRLRMDDIDTLNRLAADERLDVLKVSFHAFGFLRDKYCLLHSGGALGRGCGPLIVAKEPWTRAELAGKHIAIPGERTTAALLLRLYAPELDRLSVMPFHRILSATADGTVDAGLIIHESRFTFPSYGLHQVVDLGEWWEDYTGYAIPLGGIVARRGLGEEIVHVVDQTLATSVRYAHTYPNAVWDTVRRHAQEMDDHVIRQHIDLYVNGFTQDYGPEGESAIHHLFQMAEGLGILPTSDQPMFIDGYTNRLLKC